jgi:hypothetical protein
VRQGWGRHVRRRGDPDRSRGRGNCRQYRPSSPDGQGV